MAPSRMARLGDPDVPFMFSRGDRVAWKRLDGLPDTEFRGAVVDGLCEYEPGVGAYRAVYVVQRGDGSYFGADLRYLIKLASADLRQSTSDSVHGG